MEILVIAGVALLLGYSVISILPKATSYLPATVQANKWALVGATGLFVLVAFFVIGWAARTATGRSVG